jgi:hypothetical protein
LHNFLAFSEYVNFKRPKIIVKKMIAWNFMIKQLLLIELF